LVVEDNEAVGQLATEMLIDLGYQPTWVPNAAAALGMLAQEDVRFDPVFSDVVMPGLNGIDFAHAVRDRYPGLTFVLASGYSHLLADEGSRVARSGRASTEGRCSPMFRVGSETVLS
jgi:CheY-like chemotaxis protein